MGAPKSLSLLFQYARQTMLGRVFFFVCLGGFPSFYILREFQVPFLVFLQDLELPLLGFSFLTIRAVLNFLTLLWVGLTS